MHTHAHSPPSPACSVDCSCATPWRFSPSSAHALHAHTHERMRAHTHMWHPQRAQRYTIKIALPTQFHTRQGTETDTATNGRTNARAHTRTLSRSLAHHNETVAAVHGGHGRHAEGVTHTISNLVQPAAGRGVVELLGVLRARHSLHAHLAEAAELRNKGTEALIFQPQVWHRGKHALVCLGKGLRAMHPRGRTVCLRGKRLLELCLPRVQRARLKLVPCARACVSMYCAEGPKLSASAGRGNLGPPTLSGPEMISNTFGDDIKYKVFYLQR